MARDKCGYELYRIPARTSTRKTSYCPCLCFNSWHHLNGPLCHSYPVHQDLLEDIAWTELVRLLK